jgi:hypothetical protein
MERPKTASISDPKRGAKVSAGVRLVASFKIFMKAAQRWIARPLNAHPPSIICCSTAWPVQPEKKPTG